MSMISLLLMACFAWPAYQPWPTYVCKQSEVPEKPAAMRVIFWGMTGCQACRELHAVVEPLRLAGWPIEYHHVETEEQTFRGWGLGTLPSVQIVNDKGVMVGLADKPPYTAKQIEDWLTDCGVKKAGVGQEFDGWYQPGVGGGVGCVGRR